MEKKNKKYWLVVHMERTWFMEKLKWQTLFTVCLFITVVILCVFTLS